MRTKRLMLKDITEAGELSADIATLMVKDHDGDVTKPGYFGTQPVSIVSGHNWGDLLLCKGTISDESGTKAVFSGKMNLNDPDAAKLHSKLRFDLDPDNGPPLVEWSYGYDTLPGGESKGDFAGETVNFLQPLEDGSPGADVAEVSPVVRGAGIGTGTTGVKSRRFADHLESVTKDVAEAIKRAEAVAALRAEDGKEVSPQAQRLLEYLIAELGDLTTRAQALSEPKDQPAETPGQMDLLQLQYEAFVGQRQGVPIDA